jgi:hypothetical protein
MTTARMVCPHVPCSTRCTPLTRCPQRNLFARNLHKRAERKEREREERKPIFGREDKAAEQGSAMDMDTFLDIGADDDEEAAGRGSGTK